MATELALGLGRELGSLAGASAGAQAGGEAASQAGKAEAAKQNVFNMTEAQVEQLHQHMRYDIILMISLLSFPSIFPELWDLKLAVREERWPGERPGCRSTCPTW